MPVPVLRPSRRALFGLSATLGQPVLFDDVLEGKYDDVVTRVVSPA